MSVILAFHTFQSEAKTCSNPVFLVTKWKAMLSRCNVILQWWVSGVCNKNENRPCNPIQVSELIDFSKPIIAAVNGPTVNKCFAFLCIIYSVLVRETNIERKPGLCGEKSQTSDPLPPPHPTHCQKKLGLLFILGPKEHFWFSPKNHFLVKIEKQVGIRETIREKKRDYVGKIHPFW